MRSRSRSVLPDPQMFGLPAHLGPLLAELDADVVAARGCWWRAITAAALGVPDRAAVARLSELPGAQTEAAAVSAALRLAQQLDGQRAGTLELGASLGVYGDSPAGHAQFLGEQVMRVVERRRSDGRLPAGVAADAICDLVGNIDVWGDALEDVFVDGRGVFCAELLAGLIGEFSVVSAAAKIDEFAASAANICGPQPGCNDPLAVAVAGGAVPSEMAGVLGWPRVYRAVAKTAVAAAERLCADGDGRSAAWLTVAYECWLFESLF